MNMLSIMIVAIAVVSGYTVVPDDVSTGEETALIEGLNTIAGGCWIYQTPPFGRKNSRGPRELVIDAGPATFMVRCSHMDWMGGDTDSLTPFRFVAEAGHIYKLRRQRKGINCLQLIDTSIGGHVITCEPYLYGEYVDHSTGPESAFIRSGDGKKFTLCTLRGTDKDPKWIRIMEVDAGPITIDATCYIGKAFFNRKRTSRFEFIVESAHTYTFSASEKDCISLLDITSEETTIACEPYQRAR